ncbi:MAG TPA: Plug domain-containing protein, partial [Candidatus Eisenbacteria bacterium]|nr:Plug domain-containing protein [Candidatus Eisenbacteria bacterium]
MRLRLGLVAALLAVWAPGPVRAGATPNPQEAFDLLAQEQVVTANKRPIPLAETPSSVTVIPAAEIRAMGYRTLAEALQYVRGLYVSSDRNYSYLGVRGIRRPGDYNDKVLVTLDGHTMNGSAFGDAAIGRELGLDMENVERIEIVRGPGSTLYGSNAVFAVINVITRGPGSEP